MKDDNTNKLYGAYQREIRKDLMEISKQKENFINEIKSGLGDEIKNIDNYIKKEPSRFMRLKAYIIKIFQNI